jgi:large conductance mechanosensitive channel
MSESPATREQTGILVEFRDFVLRGNVVDLAVAVVVGAAAATVVRSLVSDLISPLIGAIIGQPNFSDMTFKVGSAVFRYGNFVDSLLAFATIMAALFFFVIKPMDRLKRLTGEEQNQPPTEAELLAEIRDLLRERSS